MGRLHRFMPLLLHEPVISPPTEIQDVISKSTSAESSQALVQSTPQQHSRTWVSSATKSRDLLKQERRREFHQTKAKAKPIKPKFSTVAALKSEDDKFTRFKVQREFLCIDDSPFLPSTFSEWIEQKCWCREADLLVAKQRVEIKKDKLPDTLPPGATSIGEALGGKKLATNHAAVCGGYLTVFSPVALTLASTEFDTLHFAKWPEAMEWKFEGNDRVATGYGRMLPLPRVLEKDRRLAEWQIITGSDSKWDGLGPVPWFERAIKAPYPMDAVRRKEDLGVEEVEDIDEDLARGWLGDLLEAMEVGSRGV